MVIIMDCTFVRYNEETRKHLLENGTIKNINDNSAYVILNE